MSIGRICRFGLCAWVWSLVAGAGQSMLLSPDGASTQGGHLAYLWSQDRNQTVVVLKCNGNRVGTLFILRPERGEVLFPPVCVTDGLLTFDVERRLTKYDYNGRRLWQKTMGNHEEVGRWLGRWSMDVVYVVTMRYDDSGKPRYTATWLEVSGERPSMLGSAAIPSASGLWRMGDELLTYVDKSIYRTRVATSKQGNNESGKAEDAGRSSER